MEFLKKVFKSCKANKKEAKKKENYKVLLNKENIYREDPQEYLSKT